MIPETDDRSLSPFPGTPPVAPAGGTGPGGVSSRLKSGAEVSWEEFLSTYAGTIFRAVRRFARTYDQRMDLFLYVCENLNADGMRRVRGFRDRPEAHCRLTTYLTVVVRNLVLDYGRARHGRFRLFRNLKVQDSVDRIVSEYRLRDGRSAGEVRELLRRRHGVVLKEEEIAERIERVERSLSPSQRWRVLSRRASRQPSVPIDPVHSAVPAGARPGAALEDRSGSPEQSLSTQDAGHVLTRAVTALSARERLVLALRYRDGLEVSEVARALGITPAQVERTTREAVEAIRGNLGAARITRQELEGGLGEWWLSWEART